MSKVFLNKDDQRLPDYYGVKVEFITGKVVDYKVASHKFITETRCIELLTFDNEYIVFPLDNIVLHFDKDFSKIVEIRKELEEKKSQPKADMGNNPSGSQ